MITITERDILKAKIKDYPPEIKIQIHEAYWEGYLKAFREQKINYRWAMGLQFIIINLIWWYSK